YGSTGTLTVSGGTISATTGIAILMEAGTLNITGGTVKATATNGYALRIVGFCTVNISGGTVSATDGVAIWNGYTSYYSYVKISGNATVTSAKTNSSQGTIYLTGNSTSNITRLEITGGTVKNTASGGNAIYNNSKGGVTISGGTIQATGTGAAVVHDGNHIITISGGTVKGDATTGRAVWNSSTGTINISGNCTLTAPLDCITNNGTGTINISGGTVTTTTTTDNSAICNVSTGAINVSGGTVNGGTRYAIWNHTNGIITISGNATVTAANTSITQGTIYLAYNGTSNDWRLKVEGGTVKNTANNGTAIRNNSIGAINISGGTVQATTGKAIFNNSTGALNISNGTVETTGNYGIAIYNSATGAINISGNSIIKATTGSAISNNHNGKITISGSPLVTSANINNGGQEPGTIYLHENGTGTSVRLEITGGTVNNTAADGIAISNTSSGAITISGGTISSNGLAIDGYRTGKITVSGATTKITSSGSSTISLNSDGLNVAVKLEITNGIIENTGTGHAIYNASTGAINIKGGLVRAKNGYAVKKTGTGTTTISDVGVVFAYGTSDANVIEGVYTRTGNAIITAWNQAANHTTYTIGTNDDIFKLPADATAVWAIQNGNNGISAYYSGNNAFIKIDGLTLNPPVTTYHVTVVSGTGSGDYAVGANVNITANTPPSGQTFDKWTTTNAITFDDANAASTFFTMINEAVTVTATYKNLPPNEYDITVLNDGNGTGEATPSHATAGTEIILTATPNYGYQFDKWEVIAGGITINNNRFVMPANAVTVKALFKVLNPGEYSITVYNDGNGTGIASPSSATPGTEITLYANPNSGYEFRTWQVVSGSISIENNKFIMPAEAVIIIATFKETVGIKELDITNNVLQVYPNPTCDQLRILNYESQITNIEIFDMSGKNVLSHTLYLTPQTALDVSHLSNGMYLIKVGNRMAKFVKQ
ncbi:MAG: T9SS type A sorting domain-containing protein, partial [Bacteroidetes bacterium]|nr:T9SS type A sorting domain-containing protein [Bacteroidota bacterium]